MMRLRRITIPIPPPSLGEDLSSPSKIEGVARRAGGVCHPATLASMQEGHTPQSLRDSSPNLGEQLRAGGVCQPATLAATQDYTLLRPDGHLPWLRG